MKTNWSWVLAAPLCIAPLSWAQSKMPAQAKPAGDASGTQAEAERTAPEKRSRLTRVDPQAEGSVREDRQRSADAEPFDAGAWRTKLTQRDLDQRAREFDRLVERARDQREAREALESWSKDEQDRDLAWTSRLALRELDRSPQRLLPPGPGGAIDPHDLRSRFDDLQRQFGGMDSMFGELQQELERMFQDAPMFRGAIPPSHGALPPSHGALPPGGRRQSEAFSLEVGPDGAKATVTEEENGEQHTREYRADTLEELLLEHPELRDRVSTAAPRMPGARGTGPNGDDFFRGLPVPPDASGRANAGAPQNGILGVRCTQVAPERARELGLESEQGLLVESVVPGTIAQMLGLRHGDVIVEVNQRKIADREDIGRVMRERQPDQPIAVVVIDGKGQRRTLTWNPEEKRGAAERGSDPKPDTSERKF